VWDWNGSSREREVLRLQSEAVTAREEAFEQRVRTAAAQVRREIERLEAHLEGDAAIVGLRARVSAEARSRFENGVITATDYLAERNEEQRARLAESVHRIQLAQARARLATILGAS
jgi:outer membrane protein TolC